VYRVDLGQKLPESKRSRPQKQLGGDFGLASCVWGILIGALVVALGLAALYGLVQFVHWAWNN
jgi:hypothetical protein